MKVYGFLLESDTTAIHHAYQGYDLPIFEVTSDIKGGWEYVQQIHTDDSGHVVMVIVAQYILDPRDMCYVTRHMEYKSRSWITRVMRKYAAIAAKKYMPRLL